MDKDKFLTVEQVASELGVHVQTVRRWIHSGELPAFRRATVKGFLIKAEDLAQLKAERNELQPVGQLSAAEQIKRGQRTLDQAMVSKAKR